MTRIIAVANQKGGAGKTTSAVNIAAGWARLRGPDKVMIIDIDPQANATAVLLGIQAAAGPRKADVPTIHELILGQATAEQIVRPLELEASAPYKASILDVMPAHLQLAYAEVELSGAFQREYRLKQALENLSADYEAIIIDCPPSLGLLTLNGLMAATEVLIPIDPGVFPLIGLGLLRRTIEMVQRANPNLHITGVFPTMVDRTVLTRDTKGQLAETFGDLVLPAIPRRVSIGESHAAGLDIFAYAPESDSANAYAALVKEVIKRG